MLSAKVFTIFFIKSVYTLSKSNFLTVWYVYREMEMFTYPDLDKVLIHLSEYLKTHFQLFTVFLLKFWPLCKKQLLLVPYVPHVSDYISMEK